MKRWKVKRVRFRTGGWGEWSACIDGMPWMYFLTHAEALAFADQRARTIEVTLPRKLSLPGVYLEWDKIGFRKIHAEDCPIDIEYLGTALLALHHRKRVTIHQ